MVFANLGGIIGGVFGFLFGISVPVFGLDLRMMMILHHVQASRSCCSVPEGLRQVRRDRDYLETVFGY